jgi:hypothetical protein
VHLSIPVGKIEGNQFIGLRYPFKMSARSPWKVTMEIPNFMEELGYEKPGLEGSEVFIFNPLTQPNMQIDFVPWTLFSPPSVLPQNDLWKRIDDGLFTSEYNS